RVSRNGKQRKLSVLTRKQPCDKLLKASLRTNESALKMIACRLSLHACRGMASGENYPFSRGNNLVTSCRKYLCEPTRALCK
ncbi:hypothetical protein, partial [Faecalispora jeddahensis]|uniref:hypothetical protein n=1 Tax=Faecalispora jeddahensis TaxID=1414721 RepID=UPI0027BA4CCD